MVDVESKPREESASASIGLCLLIWWGLVAGTAYVYDFEPAWAFGAVCGASTLITILKLIWRKSWFLTLRARCCCRCGWISWIFKAREPRETTKKQHSPWRKQVTLAFEMALPYFRESTRGKWLFVGMILLTLIDSAVKILFSFTSRAFFNALEHKDADSFSRVLILYTSILVAGAPVSSFYNFQRERLAIAWRDWMTTRTLNLYTNCRVYYVLDKDIDNPDQRIAQDVDAFTAYSLRLLVTVLDNTINLISFSVIICTIEPELFLVIIVYAFAGTFISTWIGARLVPLNFELLQSEADFRYSLVRLREHAESIAFYKGEDLEKENLKLRFETILDTRRDIIGTERNLEVFTSLYQYLTWVVPIAVVAPKYFAGSIDLGVVMQTRYAFLQIVGDLSIIIRQFSELSTCSAGIDRLSSFYSAVRLSDSSRSNIDPLLQFDPKPDLGDRDCRVSIDDNGSGRRIVVHETLKGFAVTNLTLMTPDLSRLLSRNLNVPQESGNLLITGPSGVGKSSFLRAFAGLWNRGDGIIERPRDAFFLPQQPYCTLGSMRRQLLYPVSPSASAPSDDELVRILTRVGLHHLTKDLSAELDWAHRLSLGEQQRLAFGRVLVHKPSFLLLDEATSALDLESEQQMYNLLEGVQYISVGHRPSLWQYHDRHLQLRNDGSCVIGKIDSTAPIM